MRFFCYFRLISNSSLEVLACQRALKRCLQNVDPNYAKQNVDFFVGFEGRYVISELF